jgi:hypothetical protein
MNTLENLLMVALSAFFLAYTLRFKACPFDVCRVFREQLDFKPFNCFFCLSVWLGTLILFIQAISGSRSVFGALPVLAVCGIITVLYLFLNNFCPAERVEGE